MTKTKTTIYLHCYNRVPKVGELCMNKDGVVNRPQNEEDCEKSAQWFGNRPCTVFFAEKRKPNVYEGFIPTCAAITMNQRHLSYADDSKHIEAIVWLYDYEEDRYFRTASTVFNNCITIMQLTGNFMDELEKDLINGTVKNGDEFDFAKVGIPFL